MLAMNYSDQMTGGSANVMNLQCFVGHHLSGVKVVEPFLHTTGSTLGVGLSPSYEKMRSQDMNTVKHSDIFDKNEWALYAGERQYSPLVTWEHFMRTSPRKLILVHHTWLSKDCDDNMIASTIEFVTENKFEIVRHVCLNFRYKGVLTSQGLLHTIYGDFNPSDVTVIFNVWGGISFHVADYRYAVSDTRCNRVYEIRLFHHSKQLSNDVKDYCKRHLNRTSGYVAVMIRIEYFAIFHDLYKLPAEEQRIKLMECFNSIYLKVQSLQEERNLKGTLLTMDIGKHGSTGLRGNSSQYLDMKSLEKAVSDFFYSMSLDRDEWQDSFENVARFKVSGYIAIIQQELAANSGCLILAGGGTFQKNAKALYTEFHQQTGLNCVLHMCLNWLGSLGYS